MADQSPLVSVVIPTHNRANLLRRAVDSVIAQSLKELEIIIVDDASTDDTSACCEQIVDPRAKKIQHQQTRGGAAARNTGIAIANGEYVAFLDDDDEWMPDKLVQQVDLLKRNPNAGLIYTGYYYVDNHYKTFQQFLPRFRGNIAEPLLAENIIGTTSSVMIRQVCFNKVGVFDDQLQSCQDWDLWIRMAKEYMVDFIEKPLLNFMIHEKRITRNLDAKLQGRLRLLEKHRDDIEQSKSCLARHWLELGYLYCHNGQLAEGRHFLRKGLKICPTKVNYYRYLLPAMLGTRFYHVLLKLKRRVSKPDFMGK